MPAISGKLGSIYLSTTGASSAFTTEGCFDDGDNTIYYIGDNVRRYWDNTFPITVKKNAVTITTGFTIQHAGGRVIFDAPLLGTDTVTASGKYFTLTEAGGFYNWSLDTSADMNDITTFASGGWKENLPTLKEFSVSAEAYWFNGDFNARLGTEVILALYTNESSDYRYEGYAYIVSDNVECGVGDIVMESIEFTGNGNIYYNAT